MYICYTNDAFLIILWAYTTESSPELQVTWPVYVLFPVAPVLEISNASEIVISFHSVLHSAKFAGILILY